MTDSFSLRISVDISGVEEDEDRACAILFFTTGQIEQQFYAPSTYHPQLVAPLTRGKAIETSLTVRSKPRYPSILHLYVFVTNSSLDENHAASEIHRGSGQVFLQSLLMSSSSRTSVSIYDSTNKNLIGYIQLTVTTPISNSASFFHRWSPHMLPFPSIVDSLIKKCTNLYDSKLYKYEEGKQVFYAITTPIGDLPLIAWPLLATQVGYEDTEAQVFLTRLATLAFELSADGSARGSASLELMSEDELADMLGEMLTLVSRSTLYVPDYLRKIARGNHSITTTDQWSRPGTFPRPECVAVDCEDSSYQVQEILYVLQHVKLNPETSDISLLTCMQHVANQYVSALTLGTLYESENKYSGHAYVILLPRDYVETVILGKLPNTEQNSWKWHCLVLETTNHNQSLWNEKYWENTPLTAYGTTTAFMDSLPPGSSAKWERLLRYRTPAKVVCEQKIYGDITQLHTTDGLSLACVSQGRRVLGVNAKDLLLLKLDSSHFHIISDLSNDKEAKHQVLLACNDLPPSIFLKPITPTTMVTPSPPRPMFVIEEEDTNDSSHLVTFSMRTIDYHNEKKELRRLLKGKKGVKYRDIPLYQGLSEDGSLTLIQFNAPPSSSSSSRQRSKR